MHDQVEKLLRNLGCCDLDPTLVDQALTHSSYKYEYGGEDNERLEFLGDAVLSLIVSDFLYSRYKNLDEGKLAKIKASVVSEKVLAQIALQQNLGLYIKLGKGEEMSGGRNKTSVLAAALEALTGCIFLSKGYDETVKIILPHLLNHLEKRRKFPEEDDYKSRLQEILQKTRKMSPQYKVVSQSGPDHDKHFMVEVYCGTLFLGRGEGKSKKQASQKAAEDAIRRLNAHDFL